MSVSFIVNLSGILLIAAIVWWFWLTSKKTISVADDAIDIVVDGGVYTPAHISIPKQQRKQLRFIRKDASPCAAIVKIDAIGKSAELPVNKPLELEVQFDQVGRYEFTCQMGMYRGTITVS